MNTHLTARRAAGVPRPRTHDAHRRQIDEIVALLHEVLDPAQPFIFGGDFNTRRSHERYLYQNARLPGTVVRYYCTRVVTDCAIALSWDGHAPWMDTQDLQGSAAGHRGLVRPVRVAALFDAPHEGRMLSDHDGYLVTYELSWDAPP